MISIVDAYDAMIEGRSYKKAISKEKALKELEKCSGTQFDPNLVETFTKMMRKGKNP
jgi:HD-GYP domain-containing protein (c-di-GMP phosphodiesterase class II)